MQINKNLHPFDRAFRGVTGIVLTAFTFLNGDFLQEPFLEILIGTFGVLNLISLFTAWCPVYHIAGISTRSKKTP